MKRFILSLFLLAAAVVLVAPAGFGDVLHMKNGSKLEGKIIQETATEYVIKIKGLGTQRIQKSKVARVEKGETVFDQYETKRKAVKPNDAPGLYELGVWCKENKLKKEAEKAFQAAVAADENHAGARGELGFVKYEGKWMPEEERAVILAKIAEEQATLIAGLTLGQTHTDEEGRFSIATPKGFEKDAVEGLSVRFIGPELGGAPIEIEIERTESSGGLDQLLADIKDELEVPHEDLKVVAEPAAASLSGTGGKMVSYGYEDRGVNTEHRVICAVFPDFDLRLHLIFAEGHYQILKPFFDQVAGSVTVKGAAAAGASEDWGFEFALPDENYRVLDEFPIKVEGLTWKEPPGTKAIQAATRGYVIMLLVFPGKKSDTAVDSSSLTALRDSMVNIFPDELRAGLRLAIQGESKSTKVGGEEALTGKLTAMGGSGRYAVFTHGENHYRVMFMNMQNGMGQTYVDEDFGKFLAGFKFK